MIRISDDPTRRAWIKLWSVILAGCCAAVAAVVIGSLWVLDGFHGIGVDATTALFLLLGCVGATALGVALMGLVFYSDASRTDEIPGGAGPSGDERAAAHPDSPAGDRMR